MLRFRIISIIGAVVVLLDGVQHAFAWGPATHTRLALDIIGNASALPAVIAALLSRHGASYIFGNIAADVVFAKRLSRVKQFCHHWATAFGFLQNASNDSDRAFAYGYLSHLAADTVAHNKYVPRQLTTTRATMNFGHLYWEMRADAHIDGPTWKVMEDVLAADHDHHHRVMEAELTETLLPYRFNRHMFDRMNRVVTRNYWKSCMNAWYRHSRWDLCGNMLEDYRLESIERIQSVLNAGEESPILREDPNGNAALQMARVHRRENGRLRRRGVPTAVRSSEAAAGLAPTPRRYPPHK